MSGPIQFLKSVLRGRARDASPRQRGRQLDGGSTTVPVESLPFPPIELRKIVGPTESAFFDNPSGELIWGDLAIGPLRPGEAYRRILDFGCGCGRQARQLFLQKTPPERYVGIDINKEMIRWCGKNLRPHGIEVRFDHHDVWSMTYAPKNSRNETQPIHGYGTDFTLINAHSVFTHLYERQTEFYLQECARMLDERGLLRTTWFFFNRDWFPVLAPHQHTLFVNDHDPIQAIYYDWSYFLDLLQQMGLKIVHVNWTLMPGFQTEIYLATGAEFTDLTPGLEPAETVLGFGASKPPHYDGPSAGV